MSRQAKFGSRSGRRTRSRQCLSACLVWMVSVTVVAEVHARATLRAQLSTTEAYVGVPLTLTIEVANAESHDRPEVPAIPGAEVVSAGVPSRSSRTTIINGQRSDSESVRYAWMITPRREGAFTIPPIRIRLDGQIEVTRELTFTAAKSEAGDLLSAEITLKNEKVYVGQSLPATLNIYIKPYRDAQYELTVSASDMWRMVQLQQSNWGDFVEPLRELIAGRRQPEGRHVTRGADDSQAAAVYAYELETVIYPDRPGPLGIDDVQVVMKYPTKLQPGRDPLSRFFDDDRFPFPGGRSPFARSSRGLEVAGSRPVVAEARVQRIDVLPIPQQGRPADYRGAVGSYSIVAEAVPTEAHAGDPLTLHLGITGNGRLDVLGAPPLADLPELSRDFRISDDPLAGVVQDGIKKFSVSIRPRRAGITQVPSIPLSYFDPEREEFVTVRTDPIPIEVKPSEMLSADAVVGSSSSVDPQASSVGSGSELLFVSDLYTGPRVLTSSRRPPDWPWYVGLLMPPALALLLALERQRRRRGLRFISKASAEGRIARKRLARVRHAPDVEPIMMAYLASRLGRPAASLTRIEAVTLLCRNGLTGAADEWNDLLLECEQARFAGSSASASPISALVAQARRCLAMLANDRLAEVADEDRLEVPARGVS